MIVKLQNSNLQHIVTWFLAAGPDEAAVGCVCTDCPDGSAGNCNSLCIEPETPADKLHKCFTTMDIPRLRKFEINFQFNCICNFTSNSNSALHHNV